MLYYGVRIREENGNPLEKTGRRNFCALFSLFWSHFLRERPHYDTHGGCGRQSIAQGSSNTCVRPAQGTGSRPGFTAAVYSSNWRPLGNQPTTTPPAKWLYLTNIIKTKARSTGGGKKGRNQKCVSCLITLLLGAHSGGEREPAEKKQGE